MIRDNPVILDIRNNPKGINTDALGVNNGGDKMRYCNKCNKKVGLISYFLHDCGGEEE